MLQVVVWDLRTAIKGQNYQEVGKGDGAAWKSGIFPQLKGKARSDSSFPIVENLGNPSKWLTLS